LYANISSVSAPTRWRLQEVRPINHDPFSRCVLYAPANVASFHNERPTVMKKIALLAVLLATAACVSHATEPSL